MSTCFGFGMKDKPLDDKDSSCGVNAIVDRYCTKGYTCVDVYNIYVCVCSVSLFV